MLLGREFGWTLDEMRNLTPQELVAILNELQRQVTIEQLNEQRNRWAFLAAVITNAASVLSSTISGVFGGRRRKPKLVSPGDFMSKEAKKILQQLLGQDEPEQKDWSRHIKDAKAKGLRGPWGGGGEKC